MTSTRLSFAALVLGLALALALVPAVQATTKYTTNSYDAASTDGDIALSCKAVSLGMSTGGPVGQLQQGRLRHG